MAFTEPQQIKNGAFLLIIALIKLSKTKQNKAKQSKAKVTAGIIRRCKAGLPVLKKNNCIFSMTKLEKRLGWIYLIILRCFTTVLGDIQKLEINRQSILNKMVSATEKSCLKCRSMASVNLNSSVVDGNHCKLLTFLI